MVNRLKKRRLELDLTLKEISNMVGVSEGTVSRWERGEIANIKSNHIGKYALALGMTPLEIMTSDEDAPKTLVSLAKDEQKNQLERIQTLFSSLNSDGRNKIEEYARDLYNNPLYKA